MDLAVIAAGAAATCETGVALFAPFSSNASFRVKLMLHYL
jgi:hypothetical protein